MPEIDGITLKVEPLLIIVLHVYVFAPDAVKVILEPAQTEPELTRLTVGEGITETQEMAVALQLPPLEPITV